MRISEPELERQRKHFREEAERLHNQSVEVIEAALHAAAGLGRIEYAKKLIAANRQIRALQAKLGKAKEIANKMVGKSENT